MATQKPPQQHLQMETSLLGVTRTPTSVARAPVISGGFVNQELIGNQNTRHEAGPLRWGNGHSRAQSGNSRNDVALTSFDVPLAPCCAPHHIVQARNACQYWRAGAQRILQCVWPEAPRNVRSLEAPTPE